MPKTPSNPLGRSVTMPVSVSVTRGRIGIFNRSYYEEVLVVRVHPEILSAQQLPPEAKTGDIWQQRFEEINHFERYLARNGIILLKFFLNVSKEKQRDREGLQS